MVDEIGIEPVEGDWKKEVEGVECIPVRGVGAANPVDEEDVVIPGFVGVG